jgi:hypothetical protein
MNRKKLLAAAVAGALAVMSHAAFAQYTGSLTTGPSSSATPYVQGVAGFDITSILTTGDSVGGYRMGGIPDGLGAYDNGNGTITVLMNHEWGTGAGNSHGVLGAGAYVSQWVIDKSSLAIVSGGNLITSVTTWNAGTQSAGTVLTAPGAISFNRFCSADLSPVTAFYNAATGLGTQERIFMHGEEGGATGYQLATVATGSSAGSSYILGKFNLSTNGSGLTGVGGWENALANPIASNQTVVIGNNDGGTGIMSNALAVYVGTKTNTGSEIDKAGLTNGTLKFVNIVGNPAEITNATTRATGITNGTAFTLSSTASTTFSRPEDGAWSKDGKSYYFVTTDRIDQIADGIGTQKGSTRLWRLNFNTLANGDLDTSGGTIDMLIDGGSTLADGAQPNMFDNISVNADGTLTLLEDVGGAAHNGKMWQFDPLTGKLKLIARSDPARFGDIGLAATAPFTNDEETSGVIDVTDLFDPAHASGKKYQLFVMQAHYGTGDPATVEGGQLMLMTAPVPEPETYALMLAGLGLLGFVRRRKNSK